MSAAPAPSTLREVIALLLPTAVVREAGNDAAASGTPGALVVTLPQDEASTEALRKARRLLAAGEVALGLKHAMNNPLTAILAESQLLSLEELPTEASGAVSRIVESTRRLIALVRKLDVTAPAPR
jgi:nitrogen-specific signal transduction histidine kinase